MFLLLLAEFKKKVSECVGYINKEICAVIGNKSLQCSSLLH
jgi:hypothetical protein